MSTMRMDDFISVVPLAEPLTRDGVQHLARLSCLDIHPVLWLRAFLSADGRKLLCWYQAHDAESVRLVLRQVGSSGAEVYSVEVFGEPADEAYDEARDVVIAQLEPDSRNSEDISSLAAKIATVMPDAGLSLSRVFSSKNGARLICTIEGRNPEAATACLTSAGIVPAETWLCAELNPRIPALFENNARKALLGANRSNAIETGQPVADRGTNSLPKAEGRDVFDTIIIGAGVSGICALQRFVRMGLSVRVYESGSDVGGVWHWNRYPGARIDSEVYSYGFSFSEELLEEWAWTELFATQSEISRYLKHVVERFDLRRHIKFDARIATAVYDERRGLWRLETDAGEHAVARYLIAATGVLSTPQLPCYPGMDEFSGESYHTARWPAEEVDLTGKRVGVMGTGASGVQVIQTIAPVVKQLTVFQRTPTYCVPQRNRLLSDLERRQIRRHWPEILAACRESYGGFIHTFDPRSGMAVSAAEREAKFAELWHKPGFAFWFGNFADLMMSPEVNRYASDFVRRKIRERVHDIRVARKLMPDHPFGTKRVPLESGYYETYNRDNVRLIDLREIPIERVTVTGIRTSGEDHSLDVIIYATGFDATTGALTRIDIRGEGGLSLEEKWRMGPKTFLGLLVSGFPNLFMINGPHNAAALSNAVRCIEQNVDWVARCIEHVRALGARRVVPTPEAEDEWTMHVYDVADASVLSTMTNSWFFGANTPGKARRVNIYAAGAREFRKHCEEVAEAGYVGLRMS
jgi:cation diffusion facilitator CzcD-associated flavoprotein CzcO